MGVWHAQMTTAYHALVTSMCAEFVLTDMTLLPTEHAVQLMTMDRWTAILTTVIFAEHKESAKSARHHFTRTTKTNAKPVWIIVRIVALQFLAQRVNRATDIQTPLILVNNLGTQLNTAKVLIHHKIIASVRVSTVL